MAFILNASSETATFRVFGNHFVLKPGQIKNFQEHIGHFIATSSTTRNLGLVALPDSFEEPDFKGSAEGKAVLEEKHKEGVNNRVNWLRQVIYNNQVSLRRDLETKNIKMDPRALASDGEIAAYEELANYQANKEDEEKKKIDRIRALEAKIGSKEA